MTWKIRILVATLIGLGGMAMRPQPAPAAGNQVPFMGSYSGTAVFVPPAPPSFSGSGIASHLGQGTSNGYSDITGPDSSCPGGLANVNHETLTAANDDSLTITSHDVACPTGVNTYYGTGHWIVTGGTGRFSGASGQGTFEGHSDFNQGTLAFTLTGTISAPTGN